MASKTNAIRILQQAKIPFEEAFYEFDENDLNGMHAANAIGFPPEQVFKTLVVRGAKPASMCFVFRFAASWIFAKPRWLPATKMWRLYL